MGDQHLQGREPRFEIVSTAYDPEGQRLLPDPSSLPWRQGRRVGRTIYAQVGEQPSDHDFLIGVMDTPALAEAAVRGHNELGWEVERP